MDTGEPRFEPDSLIDSPTEPEPERRSYGARAAQFVVSFLREVAETVIPAILIAVVINLYLAQATQVLGRSMEPTLHTSQRVVVEKVTYNFVHGPRRGDIVVIDMPDQSDRLIKRVIGLAGETLEIRDGRVYIDGEVLDESWTVRQGGGTYGPTTIPPLHVFVLGDNRGASNDSRSFGPVHVDYLIGRAWFSYWPLEDFGTFD